MKTITKRYKTYDFAELSEEAQDKAIENNAYVNTEFYWWEIDKYYKIAGKYGLKIIMSEICFDLDRANYCYFETYNHGNQENYVKGIFIDNPQKFFKKAGIKTGRKDIYSVFIGHTHYGGGVGKNIVETNWDYGARITDDDIDKLQDCLDKFIDEVLSQLKADYNYLTSKEAIIETIEANEFRFLSDGKNFA